MRADRLGLRRRLPLCDRAPIRHGAEVDLRGG
jgi:hypothetical protein